MTSRSENPAPLSDLLPSKPKQFVAERAVFRLLLENGESYIFKPERAEDPNFERAAYEPRAELEEYEKFKCLQGRYIPICYGIATRDCRTGLLLEDCGQKTLEHPPDNEKEKFIL